MFPIVKSSIELFHGIVRNGLKPLVLQQKKTFFSFKQEIVWNINDESSLMIIDKEYNNY